MASWNEILQSNKKMQRDFKKWQVKIRFWTVPKKMQSDSFTQDVNHIPTKELGPFIK